MWIELIAKTGFTGNTKIIKQAWQFRSNSTWHTIHPCSSHEMFTVIHRKGVAVFHFFLFRINSSNSIFLLRILVFTGATLQAFANVHVGFYKRLWERLWAIFYLHGNVCAMWHHVFSSNLSQLMQLFMFASEFSAESTKSVARENKIKRCALTPKYHFYHTLAFYF